MVIFGRLTLIEDSGKRTKHGHRLYRCKCQCGKYINVRLQSLVDKDTQSCGCLQTEERFKRAKEGKLKPKRLHGDASKSSSFRPLYDIWRAFNYRCNVSSSSEYNRYGGRGITVCDSWHRNNPFGYLNFRKWAYPKYKKGLELDRRNNNKGYSPDNCRFVTRGKNALNTRRAVIIKFRGKKMAQVEWSRFLSVSYQNIYQWRKKGMVNKMFKLYWPTDQNENLSLLII